MCSHDDVVLVSPNPPDGFRRSGYHVSKRILPFSKAANFNESVFEFTTRFRFDSVSTSHTSTNGNLLRC